MMEREAGSGGRYEPWLTKRELAAALGCSPRTIERLRLPAMRVGGQNRYRLSEVEIFSAVDKLRRVGTRLAPPHVKLLKGEVDLCELRPRQGASAVRPLYRRFGDLIVILAIAKKSDFDKKVRLATERARRYIR